MNKEFEESADIDLAKVKFKIQAIADFPTATHSAEFEKIHNQLQQALTNLDGV
jgi:hypothetical protein